MDLAQLNYTTTEKELLAIIFALDKLCSYLLGSKIIIFSDHATFQFLLHLSFHQRHPGYTKRKLKVMLNTTYGMIHTFGDFVEIKSFAVSPPLLSFSIRRATMDQLGQPRKCLTMGSTSLPFSETPINLSPPTNNVEAAATKTNDVEVVVDFLKSNIFYKFGVSKALISDQGSHFYNRAMSSLLEKYGVMHRVAIIYHPQTNNQDEIFNKEIMKILQKMANPSWKD
ncbi:hypothetical protein CR513_41453, partial [Mucuna pruriens]